MHPRKRLGVVTIILLGLGIGYFIRNVKVGLVIGLVLGLLAGGMITGSRK
jgi:uncharacterized membrane protein (UPF0136 family)